MKKCKYCGYEGVMDYYVKFFGSEIKDSLDKPKYRYHIGEECPNCKKWQRFITQTDNIVGKRFYLEKESKQQKLITPNKVQLQGEEITDEDIALGLRETELLLKRATLKVGLPANHIQKEEKVIQPHKSTKEPEDGKISVDMIPF